jgi:Ser/Thr protein kinase RdoA (MazF antagonist)
MNMESDLFFKLTPDWVLKAVEAGGFEPTGHILALHCMENRVYDLMLEDRSHIVVKFYRPARWSREAVQEEHDFLFDLKDHEIPVCAPLAFEDGESLHEVEGILYAVWPRTGGRSPDELNEEQIRRLGRLVARIHNIGALKKPKHRRRLDVKTYAEEPLALLEDKGFIPDRWVDRYRAAVKHIADAFTSKMKGVPVHRIHGDCHMGNLLEGRDGFFFLDFDDFLTGPAAQDVWLLVGGRDEEGEKQREMFVEAYNQFREFDPRWLSLVEPLRGLRYIHYAGWIAKRWHDPAFPSAFPDFDSEQHWVKETIDLEEQAQRC